MTRYRVCVFCGSSSGRDPVFLQTAQDLGRALASRKIGLVYGGAQVGCMGVIADSVLEAGGEVIGVIPRSMVEREIAHMNLSELHMVETMHERKALMSDLADAFVALPGAYGTLDEFFEILTWSQLGLHEKPVAMLNTAGFFDKLLEFLDVAVHSGFLKPANRQLFFVATEPADLLEKLRLFEPPRAEKWIARGDR